MLRMPIYLLLFTCLFFLGGGGVLKRNRNMKKILISYNSTELEVGTPTFNEFMEAFSSV